MSPATTAQPDTRQPARNTTPAAAGGTIAGDGDVFDRLAECAADARSLQGYVRSALPPIAEFLNARVVTLTLNGAGGSSHERLDQLPIGPGLERSLQATLLEAESSGDAVARVYRRPLLDDASAAVAVLAVPFRHRHHGHGAVGVIADCRRQDDPRAMLVQMRAVASTLWTAAQSRGPGDHRGGADPTSQIQRAVSRAAAFGSLTELAFAITNNLKTKYDCDFVALGRAVGRHVRLLSMSGMDDVYPRNPGTRLIRQAMEECLDYSDIVVSQSAGQWSEGGPAGDFRLHRQWRAGLGDAAVASIPIIVDSDCVAVASVTRPAAAGFRPSELAELSSVLEAYGPALQLVERASRSWWSQTRSAAWRALTWTFSRDGKGRPLAAILTVAAVAWFLLGTLPYQLSVPCQIVATQQRHLAAPFPGQIREAYVEPGDRVRRGELIYVMETRDLELQQKEIEAEIAATDLQVTQRMAAGQLKRAALSRAELEVLTARLEGIQHRLATAEVRSPVDGIVQSGDVKRRVGSMVPLGEPLVTLAPATGWAVDLQVPDTDIPCVFAGQSGRLITIARPDQPIACRITRLEPAAGIVNGQNVFTAHAQAAVQPRGLRVGMAGVATLDAGRRHVWWLALHRVIRFVRVHFWF